MEKNLVYIWSDDEQEWLTFNESCRYTRNINNAAKFYPKGAAEAFVNRTMGAGHSVTYFQDLG